MATKKTGKSIRKVKTAAALQFSGNSLLLFPPHFKTPVEVCGPCVNGEQVCLTTRFTWKCEVIAEGYESGLGIEVPPIEVCGWEMEIVNTRTKKCLDKDRPLTKVFLPSLRVK